MLLVCVFISAWLVLCMKNPTLTYICKLGLMIYVLVQCAILCSFKISIHINVCYKHVIYTNYLFANITWQC